MFTSTHSAAGIFLALTINDPVAAIVLSAASHFPLDCCKEAEPYGGWEEQFGYSMAEASLMELPVVSTRSGSIEDVVVDGKTGILVEPDNVIQLANAMVRLAMDSALRMRLGHEGRKYITRHFSHAVVAQQFFEFFNRVNGIRPH